MIFFLKSTITTIKMQQNKQIKLEGRSIRIASNTRGEYNVAKAEVKLFYLEKQVGDGYKNDLEKSTLVVGATIKVQRVFGIEGV